MQGWSEFKAVILKRTGIDLNAYKERQMLRRLTSLMASRGVEDFGSYLRLLSQDPKALREFMERLTINVSEFFRNPERFQELRERFLPKLLKDASGAVGDRGVRQLRTWSAGCAAGEEAYSLAILLADTVPGQRLPVLATDLDADALKEAAIGRYPAARLKNVPPHLQKRYFEQDGDFFTVRPELRDRVRFRRHDLLRDPYEGDFDLILCRNVVIYFTEEAKDLLYKRFAAALRPGGILFTGATEQIFQPQRYGLQLVAPFFYQRSSL
ncbi:MAG: protein-glutamate O-methyltransferase CheR [Firmicutes bacterium]|jgi:chemotaxis protein methyltransferase CheR|nr:protein-glutamate O-methyltransferase CheR [Bacillota bacterium]